MTDETTTNPNGAKAHPEPELHWSPPAWLLESLQRASAIVDGTVLIAGSGHPDDPYASSRRGVVLGTIQCLIADLRTVENRLLCNISTSPPPEKASQELLEALAPLAAVADVYDKHGLEEARPDRDGPGPASVELLTARGGKSLLTLADALRARAVIARQGGAA